MVVGKRMRHHLDAELRELQEEAAPGRRCRPPRARAARRSACSGARVARVGHAHAASSPSSVMANSRCYVARRRAPPPRPPSAARQRGSRSGPAGSRKPLPKPRASTTAISRSRAQPVVLQAVVEDERRCTPDAARAARAIDLRRGPAPTHTGQPLRRASSDRLVADLGRLGGDGRRARRSALPRRSRARRSPGDQPFAFRISAIQQHQRRLAAAARR